MAMVIPGEQLGEGSSLRRDAEAAGASRDLSPGEPAEGSLSSASSPESEGAPEPHATRRGEKGPGPVGRTRPGFKRRSWCRQREEGPRVRCAEPGAASFNANPRSSHAPCKRDARKLTLPTALGEPSVPGRRSLEEIEVALLRLALLLQPLLETRGLPRPPSSSCSVAARTARACTYSFLGFPECPRTHSQVTLCDSARPSARCQSSTFSTAPRLRFHPRARQPRTHSFMPRTRYWLSETKRMLLGRRIAPSPAMALINAMRLLVVFASESQKSLRTHASPRQNSSSPAAPPGRCRSLNWFPRQDSSA